MIKVEPCNGCQKWILQVHLMGVTIKADPTPLDAQTAVQALVGGLKLWAARPDASGRPASLMAPTNEMLAALNTPSRPNIVAQHRCAATGGPNATPVAVEPTPAPKGRPAATETASWGHPAPDRAPSAGRRRTRNASGRPEPRCSNCSKPMADGTYAAIEVGELLVWAAHVDACE